ncbi:unnamed protein product [Caenorhabditis bovis]|uniref:Uncharacterized protein n=1 Tax=Caenorhabditis bovis TaxID=2654633 RepID=A0A8S1ENP2_9PELO|nr:unnamed protein product [Caenorhabditis bovis]
MGFSPYVDECINGGMWPMVPSCNRILSFGIFALFSVFYVILLCLPGNATYRRMVDYDDGPQMIPMTVIASIVCCFLLIGQHVFHFIFFMYMNPYNHLLLAYFLAKMTFWVLVLCNFAKYRHNPRIPITVWIGVMAAWTIDMIPFTAWNIYFGGKGDKMDRTFYFIELSLILAILAAKPLSRLLSGSRGDSAFSDFSRKIATVFPYIWPRKSVGLQLRVLISLVLLIIGRLINLVLPLYSKWIVDGLAEPETFAYSMIFIAGALKFLQGNGAMGGFLNSLRTYLWIPIQQYTTREIEVGLIAHLHSLSLRWHLSRKTGQVLRIMDRGTNSVNNILNYILFNVAPTIIDILIAVAFFFTSFNITFGCLVLITMAGYMTSTILITEWRTKFIRDANEKDNISSGIATDSLLNYETVKYYGNEEYEVKRYEDSVITQQLAEWKSQASLALLNLLQNGIIGAGLVLGSYLVVRFIIVDKTMSVGDYVLFTTYILQLYTPLNFFGTIYRVIQKAFIDMENLFELMNQHPEVVDRHDAIEYSEPKGQIAVKNVCFEYQSGAPVLENVSFEIGRGETLALVGESGSGKSTLVRLLFRLFETSSGEIEYDGIDVRDLKMKSLRDKIGIVPQDTVLFNDTILYNIRFGRPSATLEEVYDAARAAMIHDKILSLPQGYDTQVGERGLRLSGGEKQRVAIARTILKQPAFIFLDEATSSLDTPTELAIQKCLEKLCASRTGVVVAHRLSTVVKANKIIVLDKGRIVECGNHKSLLEENGVYAKMWKAQIAEKRGVSIDEVTVDSADD